MNTVGNHLSEFHRKEHYVGEGGFESLDWGGGKLTSLRYTRKSRGLPRGVCVSLLLMQGRRWGAFRGQYPVKGDSVVTKFTEPGGSSGLLLLVQTA